MDKINLNLFGLNYQTNVEKKDEKKAEEDKKASVEAHNKGVETEDILNAMKLSGVQNLAFAGLNQVNPKDYLDDESIARIEGSMVAFTSTLEKYMEALRAEFPNLSEGQIQALALKAAMKEAA